MSTFAAKRRRGKNLKPKVPFGSSSGSCSTLPRNTQGRLPDLLTTLKRQQAHSNKSHYEASGSTTGWSAQKPSLKDMLLVYPRQNRSAPNSAQSSSDRTTLLESHLRTVPEENGPSLEEDPLKKLEPEQARRVLAEYDMLTFFLEPHPGFRQLHEDLHSFVYYENPNDNGDCYFPSCPTVPLADLCDGLSTMALRAKMALIAGGETGEQAEGARGSVSMQKNKANATGDRDMSPCRYLPEVDTDDAVKIWCSRRQPGQETQSGPRAWLVEVEQERSSSSGSEYHEQDDEEQDEEGSSERRDDEDEGLRVDRAVRYAASGEGGIGKCYAGHTNVIGENARVQSTDVHGAPPPAEEQLRSLGGLGQPKSDNGAPGHHGAATSGPAP